MACSRVVLYVDSGERLFHPPSVEHMDPRKTILLVEDSEDDELLTVRALEKSRVANEVVVVRDGAEALDYLFGEDDRELPQVVLLDLKLPKVDGIDVLRRIRRDARTRHLPVVVLTSSDEERDRYETYDLGVNSYIQKPVESGAFTRAVEEVGLYWLVLNLPPPYEVPAPDG